jgi:hypothetical protein
MTEAELRELVRAAIARRFDNVPAVPAGDAAIRSHPSHSMLPLSRGADSGGPCLIEPAVLCNHCGYCISYGH